MEYKHEFYTLNFSIMSQQNETFIVTCKNLVNMIEYGGEFPIKSVINIGDSSCKEFCKFIEEYEPFVEFYEEYSIIHWSVIKSNIKLQLNKKCTTIQQLNIKEKNIDLTSRVDILESELVAARCTITELTVQVEKLQHEMNEWKALKQNKQQVKRLRCELNPLY